MFNRRFTKSLLIVAGSALLAGCGGVGSNGGGDSQNPPVTNGRSEPASIWEALRKSDANTNVQVNKYLWNASLEVLSFLPVESVDPFSGVITTGYGRPPGGGRAYRATILVNDPALDARSLNVAMQTRNGPVSVGTARAVEDAILSRARQLRIADGRL